MLPTPTDSGILGDLYHLGRRSSFEARKRGESDAPVKFAMGAVLVIMGATMLIENWEKIHGGRSR